MLPVPDNHEPIPEKYNGKPLVKKYRYFNELGETVGYVGYYEKVDAKRRVLFFEYYYGNYGNGDGVWYPRKDARLKKFPLYGLKELQQRKETKKKVVIFENDRSAKGASKLGVCAIASAQGYDFVDETDWWPLDGLKVVYLISSNDDAVIEFKNDVYLQFLRLRKPPKLKIVELPNLSAYEGISDWYDKRNKKLKYPENIDDLLADELNNLLLDAEEFSIDLEKDEYE